MFNSDISIIIVPHSSEKKVNIHIGKAFVRTLVVLFSLITLFFSGLLFTFVYNYLGMQDFIRPAKTKISHLLETEDDLTTKLNDSLNREEKLKEKVQNERTRYADVLSQISDKMKQLDKFYTDLRIMAGFKLDEDKAKTLQDSIDHQKLGDDAGGPPEEDREYLTSILIKSISDENYFEEIGKREYDILIEQKRCFDNFYLMRNMLEDRQSQLADTPTLIPVFGTITSPFGVKRGNGAHTGIDIAAPTGTPIVAPADGVIIKAGSASSYGKIIIIDHGNGYTTRYGHLSEFNCYPGDRVSAGDIIGYVGSTGYSTGPHLHYEVRINGVPVDPIRYMKQELPVGEQQEMSDELMEGIEINAPLEGEVEEGMDEMEGESEGGITDDMVKDVEGMDDENKDVNKPE